MRVGLGGRLSWRVGWGGGKCCLCGQQCRLLGETVVQRRAAAAGGSGGRRRHRRGAAAGGGSLWARRHQHNVLLVHAHSQPGAVGRGLGGVDRGGEAGDGGGGDAPGLLQLHSSSRGKQGWREGEWGGGGAGQHWMAQVVMHLAAPAPPKQGSWAEATQGRVPARLNPRLTGGVPPTSANRMMRPGRDAPSPPLWQAKQGQEAGKGGVSNPVRAMLQP